MYYGNTSMEKNCNEYNWNTLNTINTCTSIYVSKLDWLTDSLRLRVTELTRGIREGPLTDENRPKCRRGRCWSPGRSVWNFEPRDPGLCSIPIVLRQCPSRWVARFSNCNKDRIHSLVREKLMKLRSVVRRHIYRPMTWTTTKDEYLRGWNTVNAVNDKR